MTLFDLGKLEAKGEEVSVGDEGLLHDVPLAARMRPRSLAEFVGQEHLVGEGRVLRKCIESDQLPSMILGGHRAAARQLWLMF